MSRDGYSDEIVNVVKQFLEEDDWHYSFDEEKNNALKIIKRCIGKDNVI